MINTYITLVFIKLYGFFQRKSLSFFWQMVDRVFPLLQTMIQCLKFSMYHFNCHIHEQEDHYIFHGNKGNGLKASL